MRCFVPFLIAVTVVAAAGCRTSPASFPDGASAAEVKAIADAELEAENYAKAARTYEVLIDDYPRTPEADQAMWLAGECWYLNGDLSLAQEFYEEFHDAFPLLHLGELGERMWDIGTRRFERGKSGLAGMGIFTTSENGLKALAWITEQLHNGSRGDDAYFFIGKARLQAYQFDDAVMNFTEILKEYPQSEWTSEALFLRGLSHMKLNRGAAYDREALRKASQDFSRYIRSIERSEALRTEYSDRLADAKKYLADVEALLGEKNLLIADFYRGRERYAAERVYLEYATRMYPETEAGRKAKERLDAFRAADEAEEE